MHSQINIDQPTLNLLAYPLPYFLVAQLVFQVWTELRGFSSAWRKKVTNTLISSIEPQQITFVGTVVYVPLLYTMYAFSLFSSY